ncbi:MAG TPA: hypothetical protein VK900_13015 [Anaerolineales bacterium]|nr:hypothetical protein [Anaerolineales bacterium]
MFIPVIDDSEEDGFFQAFFYCPRCSGQRPFNIRRAALDFTFYYLSIFEPETLEKFVVCQACKKGFDPKILDPSNQTLFRMVRATKQELMKSGSPDSLKTKLMSDGLKEDFVDKLILLAQS